MQTSNSAVMEARRDLAELDLQFQTSCRLLVRNGVDGEPAELGPGLGSAVAGSILGAAQQAVLSHAHVSSFFVHFLLESPVHRTSVAVAICIPASSNGVDRVAGVANCACALTVGIKWLCAWFPAGAAWQIGLSHVHESLLRHVFVLSVVHEYPTAVTGGSYPVSFAISGSVGVVIISNGIYIFASAGSNGTGMRRAICLPSLVLCRRKNAAAGVG